MSDHFPEGIYSPPREVRLTDKHVRKYLFALQLTEPFGLHTLA